MTGDVYGGANDDTRIGAGIPVAVRIHGIDRGLFGDMLDIAVWETVYTGPDGVAASPRVVAARHAVTVTDGTVEITVPSADRYAGYRLVSTPCIDNPIGADGVTTGRALLAVEAEDTVIGGGANIQLHGDDTGSWGDFMFSGNADVVDFRTGAFLTWRVAVPSSGSYRLQLITAAPGQPGTNRVILDGECVGTLRVPAELALKDTAKWKYRGSAELVIDGMTAGEHDITIEASGADNACDKILLYQVSGDAGAADRVTYPAVDFRLHGHAALRYDGKRTLR